MRSNPVAVALRLAVAGIVVGACEPVAEPRGPGTIAVTASATSAEPAFFQYGIAIDGGSPRTAFPGQPFSFVQTGLSHGTHVVTVTGVSAPCTGRDPQEVELRGDDTAKVTVAINCPRTTGDMSVVVTSTGQDLDPNGYLVLLDGATRGFTPPNGSTMIRFLNVGNHTVGLGDVAANCSVSSPQTAAVSAGGTTTASFAVTCTAVGALKFVATSSGTDRDPDGYSLKVGTLPATQIGPAGTTVVRVTPGTLDYAIGDVQPNCTLAGAAAGTVTVAGGDTATINVSATCTAIPIGTVGTAITDPAADTIPSQLTGPTTPHDVRAMTARYSAGWISLVVRFANPVKSSADLDPQALYGYLDLDVDESAATGAPPVANSYGAAATMGSDYFVSFFGSDSVSAVLYARVNGSTVPAGRLRTKYEGDSVIVHIPLNKLKNDDGKMSILALLGTRDRPNDIAPNTGVMSASPPASALVADAPTRLSVAGLPFAGQVAASPTFAAWKAPHP